MHAVREGPRAIVPLLPELPKGLRALKDRLKSGEHVLRGVRKLHGVAP